MYFLGAWESFSIAGDDGMSSLLRCGRVVPNVPTWNIRATIVGRQTIEVHVEMLKSLQREDGAAAGGGRIIGETSNQDVPSWM